VTDDRADDEKRRGFYSRALDGGGELGERAPYHPLGGGGAPLHDRGGREAVHALGDEPLHDMRQTGHAHIPYQRRVGIGGEQVPAYLRPFRFFRFVSREQRHPDGLLPVRRRYPGVRRDRDSRGHARHHLEQDPRGGERLRLLAAPPEHVRVAALQPDHALSFAGEAHQQGVDLLLRHGVVPGLLAHAVESDIRGEVAGERGRRQPVVYHGLGAHEPLPAAQGEKAGVPRTAPDQRDETRPSTCPIGRRNTGL
jgi:hypothetical protein